MLTYTLNYVSMSDSRFSKIADRVCESYPHSCILWIQELSNEKLSTAYNERKMLMQLDDRTASHFSERQLFHGTNASAIQSICENGFMTECNKRAGFGKGTYLSPRASYSWAYCGQSDKLYGKAAISYMFLVDALLGRPLKFDHAKYTDGQKVNIMDPEKYDHGEGMGGLEIVVSQDDALYPRYIIAFHKNPK